ncbi:MAG: hypothetical protein DBX48_04310 [Limosilactobacillus fermentum]|nr:MAG: hypothetical protein DBX48_04310 [Limosilactobacillus fermentum]
MGNELRSLRVELGLPAKDIVEIVRTIYPKYDKTMQSKCERSDEYGVILQPDAMATLRKQLDPLGKTVDKRKKDRHRLTNRLHCRLDDTTYQVLQQKMEADGFASSQELLASLIRDYLGEGEKTRD